MATESPKGGIAPDKKAHLVVWFIFTFVLGIVMAIIYLILKTGVPAKAQVAIILIVASIAITGGILKEKYDRGDFNSKLPDKYDKNPLTGFDTGDLAMDIIATILASATYFLCLYVILQNKNGLIKYWAWWETKTGSDPDGN